PGTTGAGPAADAPGGGLLKSSTPVSITVRTGTSEPLAGWPPPPARRARTRPPRRRGPLSGLSSRSATVELDPDQFVTRPQGRRAWVREGRRVLDAEREREGRPIAKDRTDRLFEACRRLEEELDVEHASHAAYDAWRARGVAADGSRRMAPGMAKPHEPGLVPSGP